MTEDSSRRRLALIALIGIAALFIVECVAVASGQIVLASVCAAVFLVTWFVVRAVLGRTAK